MCGFAGFVRGAGTAPELTAAANAMAAIIAHRGPDDQGVWVDAGCGLGLAFRRLAIIDLSPAGHQPMRSPCGRYTLVFNGEIYNCEELRAELNPVRWCGHSDTEVLLEALGRWGIAATLDRLDGMFAFALWDAAERRLTLARDRFGEKPLYWGWCNGTLLFGSELKALRRHPAFDPTLDPDALAATLRWGWIPQPLSPFKAIRALAPGHMLELDAAGAERISPYWSARAVAGTVAPFRGDFHAATDELEARLKASVERRLRADVPVAVFLSGGIDSSLLACLAAETAPGLKSFTIAFGHSCVDESRFAAQVARRLGLDHTEMPVGEDEALALIPGLPALLDAPMGDPAALPVALLARVAARDVRVALSGDGADELFGGYSTHPAVAALWRKSQRLPGRAVLAQLLGLLPARAIDNAAVALGDLAGRRRRSHPGLRLAKIARDLGAATPAAMLGGQRTLWRGLPPRVVGEQGFATRFDDPFTLADAASEAMLTDALTYLPDDLCVKTDRTTMAASLEARLPFLDHTLAAFAWSLPTSFKLAEDGGKAVLRAVLRRRLPPELADRPKHGLEVPVGAWMRGSLKEWAGDLLSPTRLRAQGLIEAAPVAVAWDEHQSGRKDWSNELWTLAVLQDWLQSLDGNTSI
jgi:asparagine synthase (glutamine-hydrolysing)